MSDSRNGNGRVTTILNGSRPPDGRRMAGASQGVSSNLADLLERVLDKGLIIAGDITLCLGEIELLQIKIRLLIASVDKAREMGIDWWQHDPALSSAAHRNTEERQQLLQRLDRLSEERDQLRQRVDRLETMLAPVNSQPAPPGPADAGVS